MSAVSAPAPPATAERIIDIDLTTEMEDSFLEYAYSVIYARALPDARDGLKPVQRRILYAMSEMGLRPDRPHVKSARVVGEVMGKFHPHGEAAIYDAMVRLAQDFSLRLPLIDGHGNFGTLDDGPAAQRYTESRLATSALSMTADLDENVVDFIPTYDNKLDQPEVLPAAIPNLLVNGASGIAVGMATNMPPHNLGEVIAAARHLLTNPEASLDELMAFVPGPDLPTGGAITDLAGVREAYRTGRGIFRTRAKAHIENLTARKKGIVVTELPYLVGPEKVIDKIVDGVKAGKIHGVTAATDLTDREHGTRLVIEVKSGFDPHAVLEQLYRTTPLEDSFGINNVALVGGQPRTLGLVELLQVWVDHRLAVVRRRCEYRLAKRQERLHLVEGLLLAIADIDEVIAIIRAADDTAAARAALIERFGLSVAQADYILDLQLRRLTKFSQLELAAEASELAELMAQLQTILSDDGALREIVGDQMAEVGAALGTERRTVLPAEVVATDDTQLFSPFGDSSGGAGTSSGASASRSRAKQPISLEIADEPTRVVLDAQGGLALSPVPSEGATAGVVDTRGGRSMVATTTRSSFGLVTSAGRMIRLEAHDLPLQADGNQGISAAELAHLDVDEAAIAVVNLDEGRIGADAGGTAEDGGEVRTVALALGTQDGIVKRVLPSDAPAKGDEWEIISLKPGDRVVGAGLAGDEDEVVFIASDASLLHYSAALVRPQGRTAGGMAGIKLASAAKVIFFGVAPAAIRPELEVVTIAGSSTALDGLNGTSVKVTPFELYPAKGRATGGVRSQRFLKGEDCLVMASVGEAPVQALDAGGRPVRLPESNPRRDGSGTALTKQVVTLTAALRA